MELITILGNLVIPSTKINYGYELFHIPHVYWNYRQPINQVDLDCCGAQVWHHDGDAPAIIVWSNMHPTEVKKPSGEIVIPEPNDVVLLDNPNVEHRIPPELIAQVKSSKSRSEYPQRHFVRVHLREKPDDATIEEWRRLIKEKQKILT